MFQKFTINMKKFKSTLVFIFLSISMFSQTKVETEAWIKDKFNIWKITDNRDLSALGITGGSSEKPLSLTFVNCNLTFKTQYNEYLLISPTYKTYTLNIGNINEINWVKYKNTNYLVIVTNKSLVKYTSVYKGVTDITYIDKCIIAYNVDGEDDFQARMLKAFNHLRSMCPKINKKKEIF